MFRLLIFELRRKLVSWMKVFTLVLVIVTSCSILSSPSQKVKETTLEATHPYLLICYYKFIQEAEIRGRKIEPISISLVGIPLGHTKDGSRMVGRCYPGMLGAFTHHYK